MKIKNTLITITLSCGLLAFAGVALADGSMGSMNMGPSSGGQTQRNSGAGNNAQMQASPKGNQQSSTNNMANSQNGMANMPGMGNMPGMDSNQGNMTSANGQHEQTQGMSPNMPGMTTNSNNQVKSGKGVTGYATGGFLIINALTIGTAGVLKFLRK